MATGLIMEPFVKICGLKTQKTVDCALAFGATHIGFLFIDKSPRNLAIETACQLAQTSRGKAKIVAVTMNAQDQMLAMLHDTLKPDFVQLHGNESVQRVLDIKEKFGFSIIKALGIGVPQDIELLQPYRESADLLLLDARAPKATQLPGGNGVAFDWSILKDLDPSIGYLLSGGLNKDNVSEALRILRPAGVDVSSGVESAPGVKNCAMIEAFLAAVGRAYLNPPHQPD